MASAALPRKRSSDGARAIRLEKMSGACSVWLACALWLAGQQSEFTTQPVEIIIERLHRRRKVLEKEDQAQDFFPQRRNAGGVDRGHVAQGRHRPMDPLVFKVLLDLF